MRRRCRLRASLPTTSSQQRCRMRLASPRNSGPTPLHADEQLYAADSADEETTMDLGLNNATAVVTGGSKGMGRAIAECLAAEGARVAALARGKEALDETVEALRSAGSPDALAIATDVTDEASVQ